MNPITNYPDEARTKSKQSFQISYIYLNTVSQAHMAGKCNSSEPDRSHSDDTIAIKGHACWGKALIMG